MARSAFSDRLRSGERLLGTLVRIPHPEVALRLSRQGFDWLFLDGEHGGFGPKEAEAVLERLAGATPCLLRVPTQQPSILEEAAACGVEGIIVPHVDTAQQAEDAVQAGGGRGLVVIQAESREAVANIGALVRVPGVAAVFVGPYDLSESLGIPEQFDHPAFRAAVDAIALACLEVNLPLGIFRMTAAEIRTHEVAGFTLLATGLDGTLLEAGARAMLADLRGGPYSGQ